MVAKLQGWLDEEDYRWEFTGRKTSQYRQIGNAFPPPVARAVGNSLAAALRKDARSVMLTEMESLAREQGDVIDLSVKKNADNFGPGYGYGFGEVPHRDHVYRVLAVANEYLTIQQIIHLADEPMDPAAVERKLNALARDFELLTMTVDEGDLAYQLGEFKAFTGQDKHPRHELFEAARSQIS